jgi:uncharacterized protein YecT (DUF1311 family)
MKTLITLLMAISAFACLAEESAGFLPYEIICEQIKDIPFPKEDKPNNNEEAALINCDSEALYYGIGQTVDYTRARHCAYLERQNGDNKIFGGSAILMMLYANGLGVARNIPLAKKFACSISGAPAEMEGRINHLERLTVAPQSIFDLCDDRSSGYMCGWCTRHNDRIADKWSASERVAFNKLQNASNHFTDARVQNEVDQSGTLSGAFMVQEEAIQKEDFIQSLQKLEAKKAPKYTSAQYQEADLKLNSLYQIIQKKEESLGTITPERIKITQRAWLKYRDAWVEFAKIKYPTYPSDSIAAWFTKKRNHMLHSSMKYWH